MPRIANLLRTSSHPQSRHELSPLSNLSSLMMSELPTHEASSSCYIVILSGSHVTGKETIAVSLSTLFNCPWIKREQVHDSADAIARSQEKHGYDRSTVFARTWFTKMQRIGLMSDSAESDGRGELNNHVPRTKEPGYLALVTCYALREQGRDAIKDIMLPKSVRVIFVMLQITTDTLSTRTLGAENPELAKKIIEAKAEDLRMPLEDEKDVLVVDSMQHVDASTLEIEDRIRRQVDLR